MNEDQWEVVWIEPRSRLFHVDSQDQPKRDGVLEVGERAGKWPERRLIIVIGQR